MAEATCAWCGATFQRRRSDQRCCDKACGKKYANHIQRRKHQCTCRVCGCEWVATKPSQVCSSACLGVEHARRIAGREPDPLRRESPRRRAARVKLKRAAKGTSGQAPWSCVACRSCGRAVVRRLTGGPWASPYCSPTCQRRHARQRRRYRERNSFVENVSLAYLCERDNWTCQICGRAVKRDAVVPHPLAPTHDHIVPTACGGENSNANAQLAHFSCNARKGARAANDQLRLIG